MVRIYIDFKNSAKTWWDNARRREDVPRVLLPLLLDPSVSEVVLPSGVADKALCWCETVEGWDEGALRWETDDA